MGIIPRQAATLNFELTFSYRAGEMRYAKAQNLLRPFHGVHGLEAEAPYVQVQHPSSTSHPIDRSPRPPPRLAKLLGCEMLLSKTFPLRLKPSHAKVTSQDAKVLRRKCHHISMHYLIGFPIFVPYSGAVRTFSPLKHILSHPTPFHPLQCLHPRKRPRKTR